MSEIVMDAVLDTVLDPTLDDVLEIELAEVKIKDDSSHTISSNGAHAPHVYTNGAGYQTENGRENGFYTEYQFSENGDLPPFDVSTISYEDIITEDDEPVDNFPSEKQQRLLVSPLYSSNHLERPMIAAANVGIFNHPMNTPIVPDMFLSLGVDMPSGDERWEKENRTYYVWKMGKAPEVALEIVSNNKGGEGDHKFQHYASLGVKYYVILDHHLYTQNEILTVYELVNGQYVARNDYDLPEVNLSLNFWYGTFEDALWPWIRWCDLAANLIPTAEEDAERERANAVQAQTETEQERANAAQARTDAAQARIDAKQERVNAEQAQADAEQAQAKVEQVEAEAEQERANAIQAQAEAEQERANAAQAQADAEQERANAAQAQAQAERERQEKMQALELAEETARQLERIREQARAAGIELDI